MKDRWRLWLLVGTAAASLLASVTGRAESSAMSAFQPYTARYQVSYRGLNGGQIEATFKRGNADDLWLYETRPFPSSWAASRSAMRPASAARCS